MKQTNRKTRHMLVAHTYQGFMYINLQTRKFWWTGHKFNRENYNRVAYNGRGIGILPDTLAIVKAGTRFL